MDFALTAEHEMIADAVRSWLERECPREVARESDEQGAFPEDLYEKLSALGFSGMIIPEEYGGAGRNYVGACIVVEKLTTLYPALARRYAASSFYGGAVISELGSDEQKKAYLPGFLSGKSGVSLAIGERGSPLPAELQMRAEKKGQQFLLTGEKSFIGFEGDDFIITLALTGEEEKASLTAFCIDSRISNILITPLEKLGYRGVQLGYVQFDAVSVPDTAVLGGAEAVDRGADQWDQIFSRALLEMAAEAVGIAQGALDYARNYAEERVQFGRPIGAFQAIRHKIARMIYEVEAARLLVYKTAWHAERDEPISQMASMAKCFAGEVSRRTAQECLQILGGYGYTDDFDAQRYLRDAMTLISTGATLEMLKDRISAA
jgi:alkylation response protein AidB-like acyl-CoA dehydrogenase